MGWGMITEVGAKTTITIHYSKWRIISYHILSTVFVGQIFHQQPFEKEFYFANGKCTTAANTSRHHTHYVYLSACSNLYNTLTQTIVLIHLLHISNLVFKTQTHDRLGLLLYPNTHKPTLQSLLKTSKLGISFFLFCISWRKLFCKI